MTIYVIHYLDVHDSDTGHNSAKVSTVDTCWLDGKKATDRFQYVKNLGLHPKLTVQKVQE